MTWDEAKAALEAHFKAQWFASNPTVPVLYPNAKNPVNTSGAPVTVNSETGSFARLSFVPSFSRHIALGSEPKRRYQGGRCVVNLFTPVGDGDGAASAMNQDIEEIWETARADGLDGRVILGPPESIPGLRDADIPAWRSGVAVSFTFDHQPT